MLMMGQGAMRTIIGLVSVVVVLLLAIFGYILVISRGQDKLDEKLTTHISTTSEFIHIHKVPENYVSPGSGGGQP